MKCTILFYTFDAVSPIDFQYVQLFNGVSLCQANEVYIYICVAVGWHNVIAKLVIAAQTIIVDSFGLHLGCDVPILCLFFFCFFVRIFSLLSNNLTKKKLLEICNKTRTNCKGIQSKQTNKRSGDTMQKAIMKTVAPILPHTRFDNDNDNNKCFDYN